MELVSHDLADGIRKIDLTGRLDTEGSDAIGLKLTVLTTADRTLSILDLSGVDFLASIGIGMLVRNAKSAQLRGGKMVILNPRPNVAGVLTGTRIDQIIPLCYSLDEARAALRELPSARA